MQVKCLRVLQYFPPPEDPATSRLLNATLKRIITGSDVAKNINKNNAQHAIVFEAIGLALALDADPNLLNAGDLFSSCFEREAVTCTQAACCSWRFPIRTSGRLRCAQTAALCAERALN